MRTLAYFTFAATFCSPGWSASIGRSSSISGDLPAAGQEHHIALLVECDAVAFDVAENAVGQGEAAILRFDHRKLAWTCGVEQTRFGVERQAIDSHGSLDATGSRRYPDR